MIDEQPEVPVQIPRLRGLTEAECASALKDCGFPAFRGKQVFHWLQAKNTRTVQDMKNLPADLITRLVEQDCLGGIADVQTTKESEDGSVKFLFKLHDGKNVESVLMPGSGRKEKMTLCISSQVGCAVDCKFCVTGTNGFFRHMSADEITDQVLYARHYLEQEKNDRSLRNIVFMGMGEPLLNSQAVIQSIRVLGEEKGANIHPKRITVSTSGIVPGLEELILADTGVGLAISLNAPNDERRNDIMPINKRYPLEQLLEVCSRFPLRNNQEITFEYVLIKGFNDDERDASQVARLVSRLPSKVNVIPFNPDPSLPFERPDEETINRFVSVLKGHYVNTTVRWSKALDVSGACGQLAGQYRKRDADGKLVILPREG